jgi:hypothetical protein
MRLALKSLCRKFVQQRKNSARSPSKRCDAEQGLLPAADGGSYIAAVRDSRRLTATRSIK